MEYYEYGNIAINMHQGNGYSLFYYNDEKREYKFDPHTKPYKSAYMPPGYIFYLYPFFFIKNTEVRNLLILLSQILVSCLLVFLIYKYVSGIFNIKVAIIASTIVAVLPEFIYSASTIQTTVFFHVLLISILSLLKSLKEKRDTKLILIISLLFVVNIYFRIEFLLFGVITLFYLFYKQMYRLASIFCFTIILLLLPWQIRNYITFEEFVPLTTSSGLNFYRGHNPYEIGAWGDSTTEAYLYSIKDDSNFEVKMNKMYFDFSFETIKENPQKEFINPFIKLFHLWIYYPPDKRVFNPVYLLPWLFLLGFAVYGIIRTYSWNKHTFIYLFLIYSSAIGIIFFTLPRYQTMMKVALIPFAAFSINQIIEKWGKGIRKSSS